MQGPQYDLGRHTGCQGLSSAENLSLEAILSGVDLSLHTALLLGQFTQDTEAPWRVQVLGRPQGPREGAYPVQGTSSEGLLGTSRVRPKAIGDHLPTFPCGDFWG